MISRVPISLASLVLAVVLATPATAQQPGNDLCTSLQDISLLTRAGGNLLDVFDLLLPGNHGPVDPEIVTTVRSLDRLPGLADAREFQRLLDRYFPEALFRRRIGGTSQLLFLSRPDGTLERVGVLRSSGFSDLDNASVRVLEKVTLAPAMMDGCPVWALGQMPINWTPPPPAAPYGIPYGAQ